MSRNTRRIAFVFLLFYIGILVSSQFMGFLPQREVTSQVAVGLVGMCLEDHETIDPIGDQVAVIGHPYYYDVNFATTLTGDAVNFTDDTGMFRINNETGVISFTPNVTDDGVHYVNISIYSICGDLKDFEIVKFSVLYTNRPPVLNFIPDQAIYQNEPFFYDVNATDPDNDTLTFGANASFFQIDPITGIISTTPGQQDTGNHSVIIWVVDPYFALDYQIVRFEITDVNDQPVLSPIGAQTAEINMTYKYDVNATDVDTILPHNITYVVNFLNCTRLYTNSTGSANYSVEYNGTYNGTDCSVFDINATSGMVDFYVNETMNGTYWINYTASDGLLLDWELVQMAVLEINHAPIITSWYPGNYSVYINEGTSQVFNITKYDPDGTMPSTGWYQNGMVLSGAATDEYEFKSSCNSAGQYNITVVVSDGLLADSHEWDLHVAEYCAESPPTSTGPMPGGAAKPACVENWRCTEWSVCPSYEIQVRDCNDLNSCGTTFSKPSEIRSCIYVPDPSCHDRVKNCHHGSCEILTDCGGPCPMCPTCSDGMKNQNETGVDCGGPCPTCPAPPRVAVCGDGLCEPEELFTCFTDCGSQLMFLLAQYLVVIVILTVASITLYRGGYLAFLFYRKKYKPPYTIPQLFAIYTLRNLQLINLQVDKKRTRPLATDYARTMRSFFAGFYEIRKRFTYVELVELVGKRDDVPKDVRQMVNEFSERITMIEYARSQIAPDELKASIKRAMQVVEKLSGISISMALQKKADKELAAAEEKLGKKLERVFAMKEPEKEEEKPEERKEEPKEEKTEKEEEERKEERPEEVKEEEKPEEKTEEREEEKPEEKKTPQVMKLMKMIEDAEKALDQNQNDKATDLYTEARSLYDKIPPAEKDRLYEETTALIRIYNRLAALL